MQYVRSLSGSVSKTWNSINPATLSGAIDVIVVEQENGDLACSPFHVRFGKFSLLRPYEKKVEFRVNGEKTDYSMKLGEGGEAFFVFETSGIVPRGMQTSPLVSPASSPRPESSILDPTSLQEPDYLDICDSGGADPTLTTPRRAQSDLGNPALLSTTPSGLIRPASGDWTGASVGLGRSRSDEVLATAAAGRRYTTSASDANGPVRSRSPPPIDQAAAVERAMALSRKLSISNIQTHITNQGDVMLDMRGFKLDQEESAQAEELARKILAEELDGDYDLASLMGADKDGNLWIYSSEEAKEKAGRHEGIPVLSVESAISDGGYSSDDAKSLGGYSSGEDVRKSRGTSTPPTTPPSSPPPGDSSDSRSYAKTLRLTSDQLKSLNLKPGGNEISFSVNRATCTAYMYLWHHDVPIVISDIDGTITKSDALGHIFTYVGRDWTHLGVAKLYTDIAANGYNLLYLTSRSVGQADTTRNYLNGIVQDSYRLPKGPVIMSPDRTFHALRREVYLRKPEVFKMACLRDILNLFGAKHNPFYAGFGNRLTDALSYRSVNIPSTRIFTINSNAEVVLDLIGLTGYRSSYVNMRDLVDHFFPPVSRVVGFEEEFTDFNYWREGVFDPELLSDSDEEDDEDAGQMGESYLEDDEDVGQMGESYLEDEEEDGDDEEYDEEEGGADDSEDDYGYEDGESNLADSFLSTRSRPSRPRGNTGDRLPQQDQDNIRDQPVQQETSVRKRWMKNDMDSNVLNQARDFVEAEVAAIGEDVADGVDKLRIAFGGKKAEEEKQQEEEVKL